MTAAEHARRALTLRALREALEPVTYVAAASTVAFATLSTFRPDGRWLAFAAGLAAFGLGLIRRGLHRRADHHDLAAEYLDAAPPPRRTRAWPPPPGAV